MYFIVLNIPRMFHSIDLRNYFSELIEKEAFNRFHFRHRIQSQLVDLIEHSAVAQTNSGVPLSDDKTTDERRSEASDTVEGTSQIGEVSFSKLPDTQAEKQNDGESPNPNTDSQGTTSLKTSSQETTGKENNSQEATGLDTSSQRNTDKESDSQGTTSLKTNSQVNTGKERDSQGTKSLETNSQGDTGKENDSEGTTSLETRSQRNTGKESDSQGTTSLETCSQENTGKASDTFGTTSLVTSSQENTGKESDSQGTTSKETNSQENTGKDGGSICREEVQGVRNASDNSSTNYLNSGVADLKSLRNKLNKEKKKKEKLGKRMRFLEGKLGNENTSKKFQRKIMQSDLLFDLMVEEAPGRTCAPADVKEEHEETFFKKYNHKHWVTLEGDILPQRCYLLRVDFRTPSKGKAPCGDNKTQQELSTSKLDLKHPQTPCEFLPVPRMPYGNVGTSTQRFQQLGRAGRISKKQLKRLGIEYSKDSKGNITHCQEDTKTQVEGDIAFTAAGHLIPSSSDFEKERKRRRIKDKGMLPKGPKMKLEEKTENGPEMQKLQQHEPFHEDVTLQDRIKERHFEEALEMMWEEGGTGIIFDTNPRFWWGHEQKPKQWPVGDEDECSLQQSVSKMKKEKGKGSSCGAEEDKIRNRKPPPAKPPHAVNSFQAHMKGFGGQIIDAHGLQESQGLGLGMISMPLALESNGQHSHEHNGLRFTDCSLPHKLKREGNTSTHGAMNAKKLRKNAHSASDPTPPTTIGSFEAHTKGIGRRIMEALGWKEGQGLGKELSGRPYAIECNGQNFHGRKGIGFHGKKLRGGVSTTSTTKGKPQPSNAEFSNNPQIPTTTDEPQPPNAELRNPTQKISSITGKLQPLLADLSQHTQTSSTTGKPQPLQANLSKPFNFTVFHRAEDAQPSASTTHNT